MPIAQLRALSQNDLIVAFQQIDALPISAEEKRALKNILRAGNNPDASKLETIIATLPKARQEQIYRIFDEIAARQKQQAEDAAKSLLLLGLLTLGSLLTAYIATPDQEALQAAQLLEIMKRAWVNSIQDEIDYVGCNARAKQPSGEQLAYLEAKSREDAASIIQTYNSDVQKQLAKLYKEHPDASKEFFVESMKEWSVKRSEWKSLQIAMNLEFNAREYARSQFRLHNFPETTRYVFAGSTPVCQRCMNLFAAGIVDLEFVLKTQIPVHINCDHYFRPIRKPKINCQDLWTG